MTVNAINVHFYNHFIYLLYWDFFLWTIIGGLFNHFSIRTHAGLQLKANDSDREADPVDTWLLLEGYCIKAALFWQNDQVY